jgi:hypothetical protein
MYLGTTWEENAAYSLRVYVWPHRFGPFYSPYMDRTEAQGKDGLSKRGAVRYVSCADKHAGGLLVLYMFSVYLLMRHEEQNYWFRTRDRFQ